MELAWREFSQAQINQFFPFGNIFWNIKGNFVILPVREESRNLCMKSKQKLPYGKITSVMELGHLIREHRRSNDITQVDLAAMCGVGPRFISELEKGKATVQLDKVLQVLACLGLEMHIEARGWQ
jgi:HTH-type transcriptional regulator/antitoxin HipB